MKIQSSDDKLVFSAIDYVQSITGDQFITATELPPEKGENDQELTAKKYQLTLNLNIEGKNGINVTKSENTYTVSYTGGGGDPGTTVAAEYNGAFKIVLINSSTIQIVDQLTWNGSSYAYAGTVQYQRWSTTKLQPTTLTISSTGNQFVFLIVKYDVSSKKYSYEYAITTLANENFSSSDYGDNFEAVLIGAVFTDKNGVRKVQQHFQGLILELWKITW